MTPDIKKLVMRLRKPINCEDTLKKWDIVRKMLLDGDLGDGPRLSMESWLDIGDEERVEAADALEALAGEVERLTMEAKTATTLLEAEKWSRAHVKSIIVSDLEAERARLKAALARLVKSVGDECFLDHNGNCQTHFIDSPCAMAIARKALEDAS